MLKAARALIVAVFVLFRQDKNARPHYRRESHAGNAVMTVKTESWLKARRMGYLMWIRFSEPTVVHVAWGLHLLPRFTAWMACHEIEHGCRADFRNNNAHHDSRRSLRQAAQTLGGVPLDHVHACVLNSKFRPQGVTLADAARAYAEGRHATANFAAGYLLLKRGWLSVPYEFGSNLWGAGEP